MSAGLPVQPVRLPKSMWVTAAEVARAALDGLARNRRVVVAMFNSPTMGVCHSSALG